MEEEELRYTKTEIRPKYVVSNASLLASPWAWAAIGAIIILAAGSYIWLMPSDYKIPVIIAIGIGILISLNKFSVGKLIFNIVICTTISIFLVMFSPQIMNYGSLAIASIKGALGTFIPSLKESTNPDYYYNLGNTKPEQQLGSIKIAVDWRNAIEREPVDVVVPIKVRTSERLSLIPKCLLGDKEIITTVSGGGSELDFMPSREEQQSSLNCYNEKLLNKNLAIRLEAKQNHSLSLETKVGKGSLENVVPSVRLQGPYTITLKFEDQQPFRAPDSGSAKYPLFVILQKQPGSDFVLSRIDSLSVTTKESLVEISCPAISGTKDELKSWADKDGYVFKCDFIVKGNPEAVQRIFITAEISYRLEAYYRTTLKTHSA